MNYNKALEYIHSNFWQGSKPGLERTQKLLDLIGNPQDHLKFIHVAGTNGKGSFCSMLSSVLIEAGEKVGTYTSPYVLRFNERMKINGIDIPDDTLAELTDFIRPFAEKMDEKPTEFELITAIAMEYFRREKCSIVVLECGMGGRLDSTNVIKTPILSVITGIALDHTAFLGSTLSEIAAEKAGIIKEKTPILYCGDQTEAEEIIQKKASEQNSPYFRVDREGFRLISTSLEGTVFHYKERENIEISLLGTYQCINAQNVLTALSVLQSFGYSISEESIRLGLKKAKWPARFELISREPIILFDGGHNPEGVSAAVESAKLYFSEEKILLLTGVMADKDYDFMANKMSQIAKEAFCITPSNPRSLEAEKFAESFRSRNIPARAFKSAEEGLYYAIDKAKKEKTPLLCLGSLYMYGEIISAFKKQ